MHAADKSAQDRHTLYTQGTKVYFLNTLTIQLIYTLYFVLAAQVFCGTSQVQGGFEALRCQGRHGAVCGGLARFLSYIYVI